MYLDHFGLQHAPFRLTPDTRAFYRGADRGNILEALAWCIDNGEGIVKLVGEVGSGKTTLCRKLATRLSDDVDIVFLVNPELRAAEVVPAIAFELGLDVDGAEPLAARHRLHEALLARHERGRRVVVLVEEAQSMPAEALEAIRLLSNLETDDAKLLQIVLFGQPELDSKLADPAIRQLRERITHAFDLSPLSHREAERYLDFRLRAAGYRGPPLLQGPSARALNRRARGLIRRLNLLADKTLLAAYAEGMHAVRGRHVRRAARDTGLTAAPMGWRPIWLGGAAAALAVLAGVGAWLWLQTGASPAIEQARQLSPTTLGGD